MNTNPNLGITEVLRPITPEQEAGMAPVGWSWECNGGMLNCFPNRTSWDYERPERNQYWADKGFTPPRPLYFKTPLQAAAPAMLEALQRIHDRLEAFEADERDMPFDSVCVTRQIAERMLQQLASAGVEPASEAAVEPATPTSQAE